MKSSTTTCLPKKSSSVLLLVVVVLVVAAVFVWLSLLLPLGWLFFRSFGNSRCVVRGGRV